MSVKITSDEEDILDAIGKVQSPDPFGDHCPACGRPHVFKYKDGTKVCEKCDELVHCGTALSVDTFPKPL